MSYQPKSYRKFLATSLAAAMVATVAAPIASTTVEAADAEFADVVVGSYYSDAVDYLVGKGVLEGFPNGTFQPNAGVTRAQAAKILVETLDLEVPTTVNLAFTDTKNDVWYSGYVAALVAAGIVQGNPDGTFAPNATVTRAELAKMVVEAYELEQDADVEIPFTDTAKGIWYEGYVNTLYSLGIVNGMTATTFGPGSTVTRGQAAVFVHRTEVESVRLEVPTLELAVASVMVTNGTTLQVNGANLADLKAEDVTVEGNTVTEVTVAADGKSASVKLSSPLVLDTTTKVTVKDKAFDVSYKIEVTGVSIVENQTFDDDTANQFVKIQVDGKELTPQELITAGYTVDFKSFSNRIGTDLDTNLFRNGNSESTTAELSRDIRLGGSSYNDYYVRVTLTKGSEVMTSSITKVTVKNLDAVVSSVSEATIEVNSNASKFDLVSSTLAAGDTAVFTELVVAVGGNKEYVDLAGVASSISVKSSDESVISVNKSTYQLSAEGPGTATVTVTYGGATYTKTLTVKSEKRKVATVKLDKSTLVVGKVTPTGTFKVQAIDQYGDPILATGSDVLTVHSSDELNATADLGSTVSDDGKLEYTVTVTGKDTGTADFTIRNAGTRLGSAVRVTVTANTAIARYTLTVDSDISASDLTRINVSGLTKNEVSTDATIDTGADQYVKINIKAFNSVSQEVGKPLAGTDYEVTGVNVSGVNVLDTSFGTNGVHAASDSLVVKAGSDDGTVTITITDKKNASIKQSIKLTVTDNGATVTGTTFKTVPAVTYATTLDYEDFLTYTKSGGTNDPRITGLTLSKSFSQTVRLNEGKVGSSNLSNVDTLYVDVNGNSTYDAGDVIVGYVGMAVIGDVLNQSGTKFLSPVSATTGYAVGVGSDGNIIFRVYNDKDEIVASRVVKVDF
jgi:hypothetical protein